MFLALLYLRVNCNVPPSSLYPPRVVKLSYNHVQFVFTFMAPTLISKGKVTAAKYHLTTVTINLWEMGVTFYFTLNFERSVISGLAPRENASVECSLKNHSKYVCSEKRKRKKKCMHLLQDKSLQQAALLSTHLFQVVEWGHDTHGRLCVTTLLFCHT